MTLRPKDVPCLACSQFRVDTYHPICPPCSHTLPYSTVQTILHDHHQYVINVPRIPIDHDFIAMTNYLQTINEVTLSGRTAVSMTVNLTPSQVDKCSIADAIATLPSLDIPSLVEFAVRLNEKSPSSTLLTIRKVLPGESETTY